MAGSPRSTRPSLPGLRIGGRSDAPSPRSAPQVRRCLDAAATGQKHGQSKQDIKGKGKEVVVEESDESDDDSSDSSFGVPTDKSAAKPAYPLSLDEARFGPYPVARPRMEPLRIYRGRSFIKHFNAPFMNSIVIPAPFWARIDDGQMHSLIMFGEVMMGFRVRVQQLNGRVYLSEGWRDFVQAERISRHDSALFVWLGGDNIGVRIFCANGDERPLASRPPFGHPMLQDFAAGPNAMNIGGGNVYVPDTVLNAVYELGKAVHMNAQIMQTIANVWHAMHSNFPLFVCSMTRSQAKPKAQFFFSRSYSVYLRHGTPTKLFLADSDGGYDAVLSRYDSNPRLARIVTGWNDFAVDVGMQEGETYVISVFENDDGQYEMRFFPA